MSIVFIICFCICYAGSFASSIGSYLEPSLQCSKYHFEEKVLEKLVRLELKMEMYEAKIKTWEELIPKNLKRIDDAQKHTDTFLKLMRIALQKEQVKLKESYKETIDNVYLKLEIDIKHSLDSLSTKLGEFENRSDNALAEVQDSHLQEQEQFNQSFHETVANMYIQSESKVNGVLDSISSKMDEISESHEKRETALDLLQSTFLQDREQFNQSFYFTSNKVERKWNKTVQKFISEQKDVGICGCNSGKDTFSGGTVVTFSSIKASTGIHGLELFQSTGEFTCEVPGFYIISVVIMSTSDEAHYDIMKNGQRILHIHGIHRTHGRDKTSSGVLLTNLNVHDTVYVQVSGTMSVVYSYEESSCMSIIKT